MIILIMPLPKGEHIGITSSKSQNISILGFIDKACNFGSFVFKGSVNSDVVIACFDEFSKKNRN